MTEQHNEAAYSKSVIEFLTVAHEYCITIENAEKFNFENFRSINQKLLPLLYLKGSLLPEVKVEDAEALSRFVNEEQWERLYKDVKKIFNTKDTFSAIDEESEFEDKLKKTSLSELLVDIYQDLKDFTLLYQQDKRSSKQCAVTEINKLFQTNWGAKIPVALRHLHKLMGVKEEGKMSDFLSFLDD
ncbi:MAG: DUF5063 domain-containing protein [Bacteroidales bacterium]